MRDNLARDIIAVTALVAGLASLLARAIGSALESIERELGTYRVEVPTEVPVWMDEYL